MGSCGRTTAVVLLAVSLLTGCAFSNIDLVQDTRVHITNPRDQQAVPLPVTITWTSTAARFAVFVDRSPIKPGASLRSIASGDQTCLRLASCPDATYLREHGVYVVDADRLTITALPDLRTSHESHDRHQVVVVVLDGDRRSGEGAFLRSFEVRRGPLP